MKNNDKKIQMMILKLKSSIDCACGDKLEILAIVDSIDKYLLLRVNERGIKDNRFVKNCYAVYDLETEKITKEGTFTKENFQWDRIKYAEKTFV